MDDLIRVSSPMIPFLSGTLKSTRMKTRWPLRSRSLIESFGFIGHRSAEAFALLGSAEAFALLGSAESFALLGSAKPSRYSARLKPPRYTARLKPSRYRL